MAQLPKGGLARCRDKPIHGSCAIYFPGGIIIWYQCTYQIRKMFEMFGIHQQSYSNNVWFYSLLSVASIDPRRLWSALVERNWQHSTLKILVSTISAMLWGQIPMVFWWFLCSRCIFCCPKSILWSRWCTLHRCCSQESMNLLNFPPWKLLV